MKTSLARLRTGSFVLAAGATLFVAVGAASSVLAAAPSDFDGDGKSDLLWRHALTGANTLWRMNGAAVATRFAIAAERDRAWRIHGTLDFTGDAKADIFWRHRDSGENRIWKMDGQRVSVIRLLSVPDTDWQIAGVCDLDGDTTADVVWRHRSLGTNELWQIEAGTRSVVPLAPMSDPRWRIVACSDLNGDRKADLLWRHLSGRNTVWLMNGAVAARTGALPRVAEPAWRVTGASDVDGDGRADVLWRNASTGENRLWRMNGLTVLSQHLLPAMSAEEWLPPTLGDFDGDGKTDLFWRHGSSGANLVWFMNGAVLREESAVQPIADVQWTVSTSGLPASAPRLFLTTLTPETGAITTATGTATVLLSTDEKSALVSLDFAGLGSAQTAAHIHGPANPGENAPAIFSLPEGTFRDLLWVFAPTGGSSVSDLVIALKTGRLYVNVHSATYPDGEIRGQLRVVPDSTPPETPPPLPLPGPPTAAAAHRFLEQSTMGPTPALVDRVRSIGYAAFLEEQFVEPPSTYLDFVLSAPTIDDVEKVNALRNRLFVAALHGSDQLRQRVALALSQIVVVSTKGIYDGPGIAIYMDLLMRNAFGNYRTLLQEITLNPAMGNYLDMVNNDKPNPTRGRTANENYAREVMQLFSIGLYKLHPNGTLKLDLSGNPFPTYDQDVIEGMARVFTGWTYAPLPGETPRAHNPKNYLAPMVLWPQNHDTDPKKILDGRVLPAGRSGDVDLRAALNALFDHPNAGPFLGRQLIQHLVTSNPSPGYVARVAAAFANNGSGVRGDMKAVLRAVLLDVEARRAPTTDFGRPKEPILFISSLVRKLGATGDGWGLTSHAGNMGQSPFAPPTVFGFYVPDYQVPGSTLLGPPLEIYTETTAVRRSNFVNTLVFGTVRLPSYAPPGATSVALDLATWIERAVDPAALVNALDQRLMGQTMTPEMRTVILEALAATSSTETRAKTAIYLIATAPQYNVQR